MRSKDILRKFHAVREGHYGLKSGKHSRYFVNAFELLQHPKPIEKAVRRIIKRDRLKKRNLQAVVGPKTGGMIVTYELAKQLHIPCFYVGETTDSPVDGKIYGEGVHIPKGNILMADDVLTAGTALKKVAEAVQRNQPDAHITDIAVLVDRRTPGLDVPYRVHAAFRRRNAFPSFQPTDCPQCRQRKPLMNPKNL